jgi:hypothetical protein
MGTFDFKTASNEEIAKYIKDQTDKAFDNGKTEGSKTSGSSNYGEYSKSLGLDDSNAKATTLKGVFDDAATAGSKMLEALNPTDFSGSDYLMKSGQELANQMGIGKARMGEMRTTIADAIPEMLKLGLTSSEAFQVLKEVPTSLGVNTTLGTEALREMGAAAKVSGVSTKSLAQEFKGVGMSLYDVGNRMAEVANIAKSVGVNVQAVSGLVVNNLKQLNLFNFDTGVKGLAKMASQAAMLGISMEDTFLMAEKLMSPEKAIEMSAALQRLGVSSSALLDPLTAMDLAQNDPEALQKEIINVSKEFTKLKADGSGFEIMPGAKRRLREVAEAMGMTASELANMSIKSADLDMKMSKIKFPSLATSEEDKTLIANMAQMKGGEAVIQIKNDITGKMDEINVKDLTADQITKLKEQQADQNKSIEELAIDQLNVLESIDAGINGAKAAVNLGKASTPAIDRFYNTMNVLREESVKVLTSGVNTGNVREGFKGITQPLESGVIDLLKGNVSFESLSSVVSELTTNVRTTLAAIAQGATDNLINSGQNTVNRVSEIYSATGKVEATNIKVDQDNPILKKLGEYIELIKPGVSTETKTTADVNMNIKVDAGSSLPNGLTPAQFTPAIEKYFETPEGKSNLTKWITDNNSGLTTGKP